MDADAITLVNLTELGREDLLKVLRLRNQDGVRAHMYTNRLIDEGEHLA